MKKRDQREGKRKILISSPTYLGASPYLTLPIPYLRYGLRVNGPWRPMKDSLAKNRCLAIWPITKAVAHRGVCLA
jgi:hypothetical protein